MCIVHTSDFSTLKIHKICLDNWIYFKFVKKLELLFFYYFYKFQVCILLLLDVMILWIRNQMRELCTFCKSGHIFNLLFGAYTLNYMLSISQIAGKGYPSHYVAHSFICSWQWFDITASPLFFSTINWWWGFGKMCRVLKLFPIIP